MDPVTHLVSGALAGRIARDRLGTRAAYGLCLLAAWLPDVDNFVGLGPEAYLRHHRGITHSLVGIVAQALLLAAVFRLFGKAFTPLKTFCLALALLAGHLWLDMITTFGTQLLAPFSDARLAWGSVFIIDPFLTLSALTLLGLALRRGARGAPGRRLAAAGLALLVAYPLACHGVRTAVASAMPRVLAAQGLADRPFEVSPDALSPLFWKVTVQDGGRWLVGSTTALPAAGRPLEFDAFTRADPALLERLGRRASLFATWVWFAHAPAMEPAPLPPQGAPPGGGHAVRFLDVRFHSASPVLRGLAGLRDIPFAVTAVFDPTGALERVLYAGQSHPLRTVP
jgi:inner membrane protein